MRPISSKITLGKEKEKRKRKREREERRRREKKGYTLSFYNEYFGGNGLKNLARYKKKYT